MPTKSSVELAEFSAGRSRPYTGSDLSYGAGPLSGHKELELKGNYFGRFSLTVVIYDLDPTKVDLACAEFYKVFSVHDAQLYQETSNLLNAFLATVPGNYAFNLRSLYLLNSNYAEEYAKVDPEDLLIRISVSNGGPEAAPMHVLPTPWFRNSWRWGRDDCHPSITSTLSEQKKWGRASKLLVAQHWQLGEYGLYCTGPYELLFTENETNTERLYRTPSPTPYTKDAFHEHVVEGKPEAVNTTATGTKAAAHYTRNLDPGGTATIDLRLAFRRRNRAATGKYLSLRGREAARFRLL